LPSDRSGSFIARPDGEAKPRRAADEAQSSSNLDAAPRSAAALLRASSAALMRTCASTRARVPAARARLPLQFLD
jgi:hypothetical protein